MKIPVPLKLAVLAVGSTAFYGYVGQLVPQKEVYPPQVVEIKKDVSSAEMVEIGKEIFNGKGICQTCHNGSGRFPDLEGIATRAATRIPGYSAVDYMAESLYEPNKYIVPGFNPGMPQINKPPIGLTDDEILTVIAYLQSLGGTPTVTMETKLVYTGGSLGGGAASGGAEMAAAEAPATGGAGGGILASACAGCHTAGNPSDGPPMDELASRLSREEILARTADHKPPLSNAGQLTLADLQKIADSVSQMKGAV
ncbi:MAG: cytochrome c [Acidobacteria bacterium]|nr:cytochrome c [Acidobacteriota bacterium]